MNYIKTKKHKNYDNYLVDENGNIYSKINGSDNGTGYRVFKLKDNDGNFNYFLGHRFTWEAYKDTIPAGLEIHHIDHIRDNNMLSNLQCVSKSENQLAASFFRKKNK